ncbi:MAG: hypothetical protein AAB875_02680 [Patescibacteria group bacterium]
MEQVSITEALYGQKINTRRWLGIMPSLPKEDFQQLCNLCMAYERKKLRIQRTKLVMISDVDSVFTTFYQIVGEYKKIVRSQKPDEHTMKNLNQDITQSLSLWLDDKGFLKDNTRMWNELYKDNLLNDHATLILSHADAFIYGRVFNSLVSAIEQNKILLKMSFITDSLGKTGLTVKMTPESEKPEEKHGKKS